jgi:hypothetical protein
MFRILRGDWTDLAADSLECLADGRLLDLFPQLDVDARRQFTTALQERADDESLRAPWAHIARRLTAVYGEVGRRDGSLTPRHLNDVVTLVGRLALRVDPRTELAPLVRWLVERLVDRPRAVRLAAAQALQAVARWPGCPVEVRRIILNQQSRMQEAHRDVISSPSCRKEGGRWYSFGGGEHTDQGIGLDPEK